MEAISWWSKHEVIDWRQRRRPTSILEEGFGKECDTKVVFACNGVDTLLGVDEVVDDFCDWARGKRNLVLWIAEA